MHKQQSTYLKRVLAVGLCGLGLWAGSAAAHDRDRDHDDHGDRYAAYQQARQLDLRGDRIERRLDRKGDRIERRYERLARELRAEGRYAEARRLERKGKRINRRLDKRGERINRRLDRQADRLREGWRHERHSVYEPRPAHHRRGELVLSVDLGRWVIRP